MHVAALAMENGDAYVHDRTALGGFRSLRRHLPLKGQRGPKRLFPVCFLEFSR